MNISDRELDRLGANFRLKKILMRLHVTFGQYLYHPDHYDKVIKFLDKDNGVEEKLAIYGRSHCAVH